MTSKRRAFNTRFNEWDIQVSKGLDGGDSGVWVSCIWDSKTKKRHLDIRYFTAKGKATGHYVLADEDQARTLKRAIDRFEKHLRGAPVDGPKAQTQEDDETAG